jgi:hypothetical protein
VTHNHWFNPGFEFTYHDRSGKITGRLVMVLSEKISGSDTSILVFMLRENEFQGIIALVGLRYDYFDPTGGDGGVTYPADYSNPYSTLDSNGLPILINAQKPTTKSQISPRIAISHPITDRDVIHFSLVTIFTSSAYFFIATCIWRFYQVGNYVGNPNIEPEEPVLMKLASNISSGR